jgi:hypothetical protein
MEEKIDRRNSDTNLRSFRDKKSVLRRANAVRRGFVKSNS